MNSETAEKETESFDFRGPAGRLEAILNLPKGGAPRAAAVICHAHPLHGGMMHYKVVFRGVGRSEGVHDRGVGEQDDVRAAIGEMQNRFKGLPLILGGFSFGSAMAAKVAIAGDPVGAVLILGFPIIRVDTTADLASVLQPRLFVQGSEDEFGSGSAIRELVSTLPEPKTLEVIEGADHFFTGRLDDLQAPIEAWAKTRPWNSQ